MNRNPALEAAVLAAPNDDNPRLVYADWLTDNNQTEYADFIRTQIELYRVGPPRIVVAGGRHVGGPRYVVEQYRNDSYNYIDTPGYRVDVEVYSASGDTKIRHGLVFDRLDRIDLSMPEESYRSPLYRRHFLRDELSKPHQIKKHRQLREKEVALLSSDSSFFRYFGHSIYGCGWEPRCRFELSDVRSILKPHLEVPPVSVSIIPSSRGTRETIVDIRRGFIYCVHMGLRAWLYGGYLLTKSQPVTRVLLRAENIVEMYEPGGRFFTLRTQPPFGNPTMHDVDLFGSTLGMWSYALRELWPRIEFSFVDL